MENSHTDRRKKDGQTVDKWIHKDDNFKEETSPRERHRDQKTILTKDPMRNQKELKSSQSCRVTKTKKWFLISFHFFNFLDAPIYVWVD